MLSLSALREERILYHCFSPVNQFLSIIPCRLTDSNRWPSDYKSDALPTELNRLSNSNNKLKQNHKSFKRLFYFGLARSNMSLLHWWLQRQDSNLRPQGYEPCELPTATTLLQFTSKATRMKACDIAFDIGKTGFEPATPCSQSKCATKLRYFPLIKYEEQETCSKNFSNPLSSIARRCGTKRTPPTGLEPVTSWLTVRRSTNWAMVDK